LKVYVLVEIKLEKYVEHYDLGEILIRYFKMIFVLLLD